MRHVYTSITLTISIIFVSIEVAAADCNVNKKDGSTEQWSDGGDMSSNPFQRGIIYDDNNLLKADLEKIYYDDKTELCEWVREIKHRNLDLELKSGATKKVRNYKIIKGTD